MLTVGLGQVVGGNGLGDAADLVDLEEEAVAGLVVDGHLQTQNAGQARLSLFITNPVSTRARTGPRPVAWFLKSLN